jgi:N-acetylglutamate synthase-like GNAT family acetyltransferase
VEFELRRARRTDAHEIADVYVTSWNEAFAGRIPPRVMNDVQVARWEQDLAERVRSWWLAHNESAVIGFVGTGPSRDPIDPTLGELDTIAVAPPAWRHGVGRRLMAAALDDLLEAGYREYILWTLADYPRGRGFYESTGWQASGEVRASGRQIAFRRPSRQL